MNVNDYPISKEDMQGGLFGTSDPIIYIDDNRLYVETNISTKNFCLNFE